MAQNEALEELMSDDQLDEDDNLRSILDNDELEDIDIDVHPEELPKLSTWRELLDPKVVAVIAQCYFVTIACILGTGILGLPVTLFESGFSPFVISFVFCFFMQCLVVYFFADLLQRAHAFQIDKYRSATSLDDTPLPLNDVMGNTFGLANGSLDTYIVEVSNIVPRPNLHMLGVLFLPKGVGEAFNIIILLQMLSILISYALAGSEAYAQVFNINFLYVIPVFVWVLTLAIVFAQKFIHPVVSILTLTKGGLLIATVIVTFGVGSAVANEIHNSFAYFGEPFLMGTVALGGVFTVMPMLYGKLQYTRQQMKYFLYSILAGVTTCAILNILWCWAVLRIVPQLRQCHIREVRSLSALNTTTSVVTRLPEGLVSSEDADATSSLAPCTADYSLQGASENGEISTVPLTKILETDHTEFLWVALLIQWFIIISVTVSYLTIGSALKHSFLGWLDDLMAWGRHNLQVQNGSSSRFKLFPRKIVRPLATLVLFSIVFAVAMANPKGFVTMLDKIASLLLNLIAGFFIFVMVRKSRTATYRSLQIPLSVRENLFPLHILLPLFFLFAVIYDIGMSTMDFVRQARAV